MRTCARARTWPYTTLVIAARRSIAVSSPSIRFIRLRVDARGRLHVVDDTGPCAGHVDIWTYRYANNRVTLQLVEDQCPVRSPPLPAHGVSAAVLRGRGRAAPAARARP
jgi:hypothetical protein